MGSERAEFGLLQPYEFDPLALGVEMQYTSRSILSSTAKSHTRAMLFACERVRGLKVEILLRCRRVVTVPGRSCTGERGGYGPTGMSLNNRSVRSLGKGNWSNVTSTSAEMRLRV